MPRLNGVLAARLVISLVFSALPLEVLSANLTGSVSKLDLPAKRETVRLIRSDARAVPESSTLAQSKAFLLGQRETGAGEVQTALEERRNISIDHNMHQVDTLVALASHVAHANRAPSRDLPKKFITLQANANTTKHDEAASYFLGWVNDSLDSAHMKRYKPPKVEWPEAVGGALKQVKLVLGVISIRSHTQVHNAHRTTWMKEKGVCKVTDRMKNDCHVFPFLVFGNVTDPSIKKATTRWS